MALGPRIRALESAPSDNLPSMPGSTVRDRPPAGQPLAAARSRRDRLAVPGPGWRSDSVSCRQRYLDAASQSSSWLSASCDSS